MMLVMIQCPPCRTFTPELIDAYNSIREQGKNFEVIFVSSDRGAEAYDDYYATMPWLAIPYDDPRGKQLKAYFAVEGKNNPTRIVNCTK